MGKRIKGEKKQPERIVATKEDTEPDWTHECSVCGSTPVVPLTGMCGPCTYGESETVAGNW